MSKTEEQEKIMKLKLDFIKVNASQEELLIKRIKIIRSDMTNAATLDCKLMIHRELKDMMEKLRQFKLSYFDRQATYIYKHTNV